MDKQIPKFTTVKVSSESRNMLRMLAALTAEKQYQIIERVLKTELEKVEKRKKSQ